MRQSTQNTFKRIALYFILLKCWKMCFTSRDVCHSYDQCQYADLCNSEGWRLIFIDFSTHSGTLRWSSFGELLLLEFIFHSFLFLVNLWKKIKKRLVVVVRLWRRMSSRHWNNDISIRNLDFYCMTRFWFQNLNHKGCCPLFTKSEFQGSLYQISHIPWISVRCKLQILITNPQTYSP